jgi:hypothetical protein
MIFIDTCEVSSFFGIGVGVLRTMKKLSGAISSITEAASMRENHKKNSAAQDDKPGYRDRKIYRVASHGGSTSARPLSSSTENGLRQIKANKHTSKFNLDRPVQACGAGLVRTLEM